MRWTAERPEGFFAFVAVASLGEGVLLASAGHSDRPEWDLIASVAFVAVIGYALVVVRQDASSHLAASPAYLFLVVVALWRHADGGALSGFVPLLALPVPIPRPVLRESVALVYRRLAFSSAKLAEPLVVSAFTSHHATKAKVASMLDTGRRLLPELMKPPFDFAQVRADGVVSLEVARSALELYEVDESGLDRLDQSVLDVLCRRFGGGPVGVGTLAVILLLGPAVDLTARLLSLDLHQETDPVPGRAT